MHTMVLGFAGYGLLLSSCVALIFLLRLGCIKDILKSPLQVLSTSDTLISMITSIILLVNQSLPLTSYERDPLTSDANKLRNTELFQDRDSEKYDKNQTCMRFYNKHNYSWPGSQAINLTTTNCTFEHVLMHYAMFLVPFANAFISLLIYSMQCSSGMSCINEKCSSLTKSLQNMNKDLKNDNRNEQSALANTASSFRRRGSDIQEELNVISKAPKIHDKTQETIVAIPNNESIPMNLKKVQKFANVGLITQWLVPVLVTVILYFSKAQEMNELTESNEMECIFKINYPLESCNKIELTTIESATNYDVSYNDLTVEVEDPDTLRISYPDAEVIDQVVSSVRNVVQSALNNTCKNSTGLKYYNRSRPWNITKYITVNNSTHRMASDEAEMLRKLTNIQQVLNNKELGILNSDDCTSTNKKNSGKTDQQIHGNEELKLFDDVLKDTKFETTTTLPLPRPETRPQDLFPQEVPMAAEIIAHHNLEITHINNTNDQIPKKSLSQKDLYVLSNDSKMALIKTENITRNPNEQIYANIIKRIRDTVTQFKVKEQTLNLGKNYEANDSKFSSSESRIPSLRSGSRKLQEDKKNSFNDDEGRQLPQTVIHMDKLCFLSTKFLKIHILILLFFIYFIPVLISGILQTRAIYMCKNFFQKIEAADRKCFELSQVMDRKKLTTNENPPSKSGWFLDETDNVMKSNSSNSENIAFPNVDSASFQRGVRTDDKNEELISQLENQKAVYKNILYETKSMQMLFSILTKSLTLGVLMWTPVFLDILSKVFLCASTPAWLANVLYLLGVSFGIVKNFFNVAIAKINKNLNDQIYGKENSIHPSA